MDSPLHLIVIQKLLSTDAHLGQCVKGCFMFVNTNFFFNEIKKQMTKKISCYSPYLNTLWRTGGFLTNSHSPQEPSDYLVVFDTERKSSVIFEANRLQIPNVSLVDSSMLLEYYKRITYPVMANDSVQFVYLFCNLITKTFLLNQKESGGSDSDPSPVFWPGRHST
ncbi:hypothetical protein UlMin_025216 [Ulmus minor]